MKNLLYVQPEAESTHIRENELMRQIAEDIPKSQYPIADSIQAILEAIKNNQVIAVVAETGAGKSTQIPIALLKAGYTYINITTPNRAAATTISKRVSDELGVEHGELAGYQTAFEKLFGSNTQILYSTEGLELIKQLCDEEGDSTRVLILDEIQEWGINIEALVGFLKFKIKNGFKTKVILMSATMDENVAKFFGNAPVIRVPGRQYPIEEREGTDMVTEITTLVKEEKNVLAFVAGKYEISHVHRALKRLNVNADIFPMHADLPLEEQEVVFKPTSRPKVVIATNVAQTSITIPDIDAVVDSGLERHMAVIDGLETLTIGNISRSDMLQRKGRAGRTKPGIYVWCGEVSKEELQEHSTPEIYTGSITQVVLRLAYAGINAGEIEFFHQPPIEKILEAQKTLRILGAFDENNEITEIGEVMALLPISAGRGRSIVESVKRGVAEDVVTIAAIQECGGIKLSNVPYGKFTRELSNDSLADLDSFNYLQKAIRASNWPISNEVNPFDGFIKRNYYRIMELRVKIFDVLYKLYDEDDLYSSGDRKQIALSCAAGLVEHLYIRESNGWYSSVNDSSRRKIDKCSCCLLAQRMVLGIPKNISLYKRAAEAETQILYLLGQVMVVDKDMLAEIAPHLLRVEENRNCDPTENDYSVSETIYFGDTILDSKEYQITDVDERRDMAASWLAENTFKPNDENDPKLNLVLKNNRRMFRGFNDARTYYTHLLFSKARNSVPSFAKPKNYAMLQCRD